MQLTTRSSARVWAYMPLSPALPNGVRTPSRKTTSRRVRDTGGPSQRRTVTDWRVTVKTVMVPVSNIAGKPHLLGGGYGRRFEGRWGSRGSRAIDGLLDDGGGDVDLPLTGPEPEQGLGDGLQGRFGRGSPQHPAQEVRGQQVLHGNVVGVGELTQGCAGLNQPCCGNRITFGPGSGRRWTVGARGESGKISLGHLAGALQRAEPLALVSAY